MNFLKLTFTGSSRNVSIIRLITPSQSRTFQTSRSDLLSQEGKEKGKSRLAGGVIIRLYDRNGAVIGHKTKQEAESIAKKNGFTLIPMEIVGKPKYPEYQLKPLHEAFVVNEEMDKGDESGGDKSSSDTKKDAAKTKKDIKRITFETSIASNDLKVKMDQINRWITKGKEVHATIVGARSVPISIFSAQLYQMFVKDTRFLMKKQKGENLKLIMDKRSDTAPADVTESPEEDTSQLESSDHEPYSKPKNDLSNDLVANEAELEKMLKELKKSKSK